MVLKVDLCEPGTPHIKGKDTGHESGLQSVLRTSTHKVFRFGAVSDLDIPWATLGCAAGLPADRRPESGGGVA